MPGDPIQPDAPPRLEPGAELAHYQVVRLIGEGGMAEVYEAHNKRLDKRVALKVMRAHLSESDDAVERFLREGKNAARLRHPNVVEMFDFGVEQGMPYLVLEYLEGETLAEMLDRTPKLALPDAIGVMLPIISAIASGHEHGVIHRDLKPENVFLARDGRTMTPKLMDYGVSRVLKADAPGDSLTIAKTVVGTPEYMAPEQARGEKPITERADIYALGIMLYELTTGRLPRTGRNLADLLRAVAFEKVKPPRELEPDLPEAFEATLMKALASKACDRHVSAESLALALLPFASPQARAYWNAELTGGDSDDDELILSDALLPPPPPAESTTQLDAPEIDAHVSALATEIDPELPEDTTTGVIDRTPDADDKTQVTTGSSAPPGRISIADQGVWNDEETRTNLLELYPQVDKKAQRALKAAGADARRSNPTMVVLLIVLAVMIALVSFLLGRYSVLRNLPNQPSSTAALRGS